MIVHNPNNLPTKPIADLLPSQGDLKDLPDNNYKKLKNTIERRGFSYPVYVWESPDKLLYLLDGHQRQRVLTTEGWNEPIPYLKIPAKDMQEAMARLLEITSQYATITQEGIDEFIGKYELDADEVYSATSYDALAFGKTEEEPEVEEDEAPEVDESEPPASKIGEIYQLGRHRLMCGDSTDFGGVSDLLDGADVDIILTDPPYGMNAVSGSGVLTKTYGTDIIGDDDNTIALKAFSMTRDINAKQEVWWGANYYSSALPDSECWIVWNKNNGGSDQTDAELAWANMRSVVRMFTQSSEKINRVHPTQKPIELSAWVFEKFNSGQNVLDLFLGSGSTLIACEQTDRTCYGMELDPKYVDVIRKRYAKFTNDNELPDNWEELTKAVL